MPHCSRCRRPAITLVRYNGRHYCAMHFSQFVEERVKREVRRQCCLKRGDRVVVGLSGGKDSSVALFLLHKYLAGRAGFPVEAITVDEGISGYRDSTLFSAKKLCTNLGIPHHIITFKGLIGQTLDSMARKTKKSGEFAPCTYCGVFRRMALNRKAREIGATHLATGLNLDDTAQSVLMNICRGDIDKTGRMGPHRHVREGLIPRIQPLLTIPEKETYLYAILNGIVFNHSECPYASLAQRNSFRAIVMELEDETPGTRHAIVASAQRVTRLLDAEGPAAILNPCSVCGEPTGQNICRGCSLLATMKMGNVKDRYG